MDDIRQVRATRYRDVARLCRLLGHAWREHQSGPGQLFSHGYQCRRCTTWEWHPDMLDHMSFRRSASSYVVVSLDGREVLQHIDDV